ncbi:hypothetical protein KKC88_02575 [Patescibacteria group bacterium]|nr:hypothetical protein [Patescibacteria group bacterium]MBU1673688.1 hypothetical protein [Patescibacteria group bacterium]MBU1963498.1 hypothetical protein [Patescibacteria group bacterium]
MIERTGKKGSGERKIVGKSQRAEVGSEKNEGDKRLEKINDILIEMDSEDREKLLNELVTTAVRRVAHNEELRQEKEREREREGRRGEVEKLREEAKVKKNQTILESKAGQEIRDFLAQYELADDDNVLALHDAVEHVGIPMREAFRRAWFAPESEKKALEEEKKHFIETELDKLKIAESNEEIINILRSIAKKYDQQFCTLIGSHDWPFADEEGLKQETIKDIRGVPCKIIYYLPVMQGAFRISKGIIPLQEGLSTGARKNLDVLNEKLPIYGYGFVGQKQIGKNLVYNFEE